MTLKLMTVFDETVPVNGVVRTMCVRLGIPISALVKKDRGQNGHESGGGGRRRKREYADRNDLAVSVMPHLRRNARTALIVARWYRKNCASYRIRRWENSPLEQLFDASTGIDIYIYIELHARNADIDHPQPIPGNPLSNKRDRGFRVYKLFLYFFFFNSTIS